ncbi:MAG TPA: hypothetical protein DCX89_05710 [Saprospirales bacterium]|nr:hypothetical protein [Saprospirales bacterium]
MQGFDRMDDIIIATSDIEILGWVKAEGLNYEQTFRSNSSTVENCAQVARRFWSSDIILDIPLDISPEVVKALHEVKGKMLEDSWMQIACIRKRIADLTILHQPESIKVVCDRYNKVLFVSRAAIPYNRNENPGSGTWYEYLPLHAFRNKSLQEITELRPSPLESSEQIEALRWLENNYAMYAFGE